MALRDFATQEQGVRLLQRSLQRGRLGHAYLFSGDDIAELETIAATLAKTLNCDQPLLQDGTAIDCCDHCLTCRKIEHRNHGDIHWIRPESKSRVIVIEQIRDLMQAINLKPTEARYKVAVIVAADRLNVQAANAFLKTLEEPPPASVLVLLTTEPQKLLETILSRCLRLTFGGHTARRLQPPEHEFLVALTQMAAAPQKSLIGRYRLLDVLLSRLANLRTAIDESLTARSPLQLHHDAEKDLREKWEDELTAAIEAEYRRQRSDLLRLVQLWLRDIWLYTMGSQDLAALPDLQGSREIASRITTRDALSNLDVFEELQRRLGTNVQEALALEVSLLKLRL